MIFVPFEGLWKIIASGAISGENTVIEDRRVELFNYGIVFLGIIHGRTHPPNPFSNSFPAAINIDSEFGGPTIWTPTGIPVAESNPSGQANEGKPRTLINWHNSKLKGVKIFILWNGASVGQVGSNKMPFLPSAWIIWWRNFSNFCSILNWIWMKWGMGNEYLICRKNVAIAEKRIENTVRL